jgi:DNA-binding response OmpR family regulator
MQSKSMSPMRILVVEDEPLIRLFVFDTLEDAGFHVVEAANAAEAIALMGPDCLSFDAVVIDVGLPDRNGDVLAEEIRSVRQDLPVVIASGHDRTTLERRFAGDGQLRVLSKPYHGDTLLAALHAMGVSGTTDPD